MMARWAALLAALMMMAACERAPEQAARPALWEVARADGTPAGWLFGTMHLLPGAAKWRSPALDEAVAQSGLLVVEVRDLDPKSLAPVLASLARPCACPPLDDRLPPPERALLAGVLADAGLARGALDRTETWAAALSLAAAETGAQGGGGPGADAALIADYRNRPILELEGAAKQLAIFDRLPEASQRAMLADVVARHGEDTAAGLADAWLAGDEKRIAAEMRSGMMADPTIYRALLADRNAAWLRTLGPLLARGRRPLVAVGAAHVVGEDGLAARLAAQGYTVRRVQ